MTERSSVHRWPTSLGSAIATVEQSVIPGDPVFHGRAEVMVELSAYFHSVSNKCIPVQYSRGFSLNTTHMFKSVLIWYKYKYIVIVYIMS